MEHVADPLVKKPSVLRSQSETIGFVIMTAALVIAPFVTYPLFLMQAMCFALFACAFNLLIGYVGLLSFGHALYFGWASYLSAYSAKVWGFPPELAILTGTATAAVCGLVAGSLAIRRQGIYFAMITLALAQMMYFFALQAKFTGGEDGIQAVPRGVLFGIINLKNEMSMYAVVLPTSWEPRPASWRRRVSRASSLASGVPIIQEWFRDSGSTKAVSPPPVRQSIISSDPILRMMRQSQRHTPPAWKP